MYVINNEEQIITGYMVDGAMGSSGGGRVRKLYVVCLHNNAIVARCILVTILHCETPEPCLSAIYIVSSIGTSLKLLDNGEAPVLVKHSIISKDLSGLLVTQQPLSLLLSMM